MEQNIKLRTMKLQAFILLELFFTLVSCDPAQTIEFENKSVTESKVKFYFKGDDYYKFDGFLTKDSLIISLKSSEKKMFDFGIGTWEIHNSLDSLVHRVERVEIETVQSTTTFKGREQIESFFKDRLIDDRYRARIIIEIE